MPVTKRGRNPSSGYAHSDGSIELLVPKNNVISETRRQLDILLHEIFHQTHRWRVGADLNYIIDGVLCSKNMSGFMVEEGLVDKCAIDFAKKHGLSCQPNYSYNLYMNLVDKIETRSPQIVEEYRKKITEKVEQLLGDTQIDENLLATEIVMFSDKICVDEEMVRLRTHVEHVKETLAAGENIGRKLDFLIQEMNREANTTLSKANDSEVSEYGIDLKTEIEKIREQIQNIE